MPKEGNEIWGDKGGIESWVTRGKENEVTKEGKEWSEKDRKRS